MRVRVRGGENWGGAACPDPPPKSPGGAAPPQSPPRAWVQRGVAQPSASLLSSSTNKLEIITADIEPILLHFLLALSVTETGSDTDNSDDTTTLQIASLKLDLTPITLMIQRHFRYN